MSAPSNKMCLSAALRVHISVDTKLLLDRTPAFVTTLRGTIEVKVFLFCQLLLQCGRSSFDVITMNSWYKKLVQGKSYCRVVC